MTDFLIVVGGCLLLFSPLIPVVYYFFCVDLGLAIRGKAGAYITAKLEPGSKAYTDANSAWFSINMDDLAKEIFMGRDPWLLYPSSVHQARYWEVT